MTRANPSNSGKRERCRQHKCIPGLVVLCVLLVCTSFRHAAGQNAGTMAPAQMTTDEVVRQLVEHNSARAEKLRYYSSERHYHVVYHGFPKTVEASMRVKAIYSAPSTRTFVVLSQSGSHLLLDHVLKKLLKSEQDAARIQNTNALTPANYQFKLIGREVEDGRALYVLNVEPKAPSRFLYRGTIWVDATDYAVVRIEAQPAESLSFWIRKTNIHHVYRKAGDFWLPESDWSETKVRMGGTAVLTIDYGSYNFAPEENRAALLPEGSAAR